MTKKGKKMGRPPGGKLPHNLQMRVSAEFLKVIDGWRRAQSGEDIPSRSDAVRHLVETHPETIRKKG